MSSAYIIKGVHEIFKLISYLGFLLFSHCLTNYRFSRSLTCLGEDFFDEYYFFMDRRFIFLRTNYLPWQFVVVVTSFPLNYRNFTLIYHTSHPHNYLIDLPISQLWVLILTFNQVLFNVTSTCQTIFYMTFEVNSTNYLTQFFFSPHICITYPFSQKPPPITWVLTLFF